MPATGRVASALDVLQRQGNVKEIPNDEERVRVIAKSYIESPENTLIVSPDNASRRRLIVAVRQELKATGALAPQDHTFRVLVQRQDMTGAERSWASHYEIKDLVRHARGSKAIAIKAASYASVVAIDPIANLLTVQKANQELATYDPRRLAGVSVYREIDREFSVGDRIQFTAPDKSLSVAHRDLAMPMTRISPELIPSSRTSCHCCYLQFRSLCLQVTETAERRRLRSEVEWAWFSSSQLPQRKQNDRDCSGNSSSCRGSS